MSLKKNTFFIETYGCQMNVYDSAKMRAWLKSCGWAEVPSIDEAGLVIVNSCAVRGHAEERVLGRVAELGGLKCKSPEIRLVLAGCVAQEHGRKLLDRFPHLDAVIGTESYDCIVELLSEAPGEPVSRVNQCLPEPGRRVLPDFGGRVSAMVAVMRGCDNFCSYCLVPFVRGRERSRDSGEVLSEIEGLVGQGVREVTLVGQNVNSYRWADKKFPNLLGEAAGVSGLERLRFITSHPKDLDRELISVMAEGGKVCPHLHLPLQSGSDRILKLMNRGYNVSEYLRKAELSRSLIPGLTLTTDVIAGFPGETEDEFQMTLRAMEQAGFDEAFTYKYSPRPGTAAAGLQGQLPDEVRQERLLRLIDQQQKMSLASKQRDVGRTFKVLTEGPSRQGQGQYFGRTDGNKPVVFTSLQEVRAGEIVRVLIEKASSSTLMGKAES